MARQELYDLFTSFPSYGEVEDICLLGRGEETCRYLFFRRERYACQKTGCLKDDIDKKVKSGELGAKGDNCEGLLGAIKEHEGLLVGNKIEIVNMLDEEPKHRSKTEGFFKGIDINGKMVKFKTASETMSIAKDHLRIRLELDGFLFTTPGVTGHLKVFFEREPKTSARYL